LKQLKETTSGNMGNSSKSRLGAKRHKDHLKQLKETTRWSRKCPCKVKYVETTKRNYKNDIDTGLIFGFVSSSSFETTKRNYKGNPSIVIVCSGIL